MEMEKIWKEIDILRHAIANEKLELKCMIDQVKKLRARVNIMDKRLFRLIEKVEKVES
jgi:ubiquinone biosynthesis protein UbiJ